MVVYIASPYTVGNQAENVRAQIDAAEELMNHNIASISPLLSHFHHLVYPHTWQEWMDHSISLLSNCNALIRLPGESKGADIEVEHARQMGIMVYFSVEEFLDVLRRANEQT